MTATVNARRSWTEAETDQLRTLRAEGLSQAEIAVRLGRSEYAIACRCKAAGIRNDEAAKRHFTQSMARIHRSDIEKSQAIRAKIAASYTPERRQRQAEIMRRVNAQRVYGPVPRDKVVKMVAGLREFHKRRMSWLPAKYQDEYIFLTRNKGIPAKEAKKCILAKVARDDLKITARLHASEAADFMRKFAPIKRTDAGWQYGSTILTPEELIERAQLRGWKPFELRRAA